jgi:hypothetical protein
MAVFLLACQPARIFFDHRGQGLRQLHHHLLLLDYDYLLLLLYYYLRYVYLLDFRDCLLRVFYFLRIRLRYTEPQRIEEEI